MKRDNTDEPLIESGFRASLAALATTLCFSGSAIFIRYGLAHLSSPLIGVTIGMVVCTVAYAIMLLLRGDLGGGQWQIAGNVLRWQLLAGTLVGLATWARWTALNEAPIAIVVALGRLSIPVVLLLSPIIVGQKYEQVTPRVWLGAGIILLGSTILTFFG